MSVSLVVPTFRRAQALARCLEGIERLDQSYTPNEIIVVRRADDLETPEVLKVFTSRGITEVVVDRPGQVAASQAGARRASGEVVAFLDDDAVPRPDWLVTLLRHYANEEIGAVGGRDVIHNRFLDHKEWDLLTERVGQVGRWGRLIGNHHLGAGDPRLVDHLKGVNMSVRRKLLTFPSGLKGQGAQVYNDLAICLAVKNAGWKIIYDPGALVDHYLEERHDEDGRLNKSTQAIASSAYNLTYVLGSLRPDLRFRLFLYGLIVGNRAVPGLGKALTAMATGDRETIRRLMPSLAGQIAGWASVGRSPLSMQP